MTRKIKLIDILKEVKINKPDLDPEMVYKLYQKASGKTEIRDFPNNDVRNKFILFFNELSLNIREVYTVINFVDKVFLNIETNRFKDIPQDKLKEIYKDLMRLNTIHKFI